MEALLLIFVLIALILLGVPVAFSLIATAILGSYLYVGGWDAVAYLPTQVIGELDDYVLIAVPLFLLMAQILLHGGVGKSLFDLASAWVGHWPGGLAVAALLACAIFSAISGSSVATAVTVGAVAIPEMIRRGYPRAPVLGVVAAGGTMGILIPPSIPLILYGSITSISVGALFTAAIVPGLLLTGLFILFSIWYFGKNSARLPVTSWSQRLMLLGANTGGLMVPLVVIVGIYRGWFTPTEAAAIGSVLALLVTLLWTRSLGVTGFLASLKATARDTAMVLFIVVGAMMFGRVLTNLRVPQMITEAVAGADLNRWVVFVLILLLLLLLGMFLEVISILLIAMPILYPLITSLGFDPIWFAVVFVITMEVALLTPPVGLNLFVVQGISGSKIGTVVRGTIPYFFIMLAAIIILVAVPQLTSVLLQ